MRDTQIVVGPNASLSTAQAGWVMAAVSAVAFMIAIGFALMGFWPVVPFAGLEVAALGAAMWVSLRRNRYREVLGFEAGRVTVGFGWMGQGAAAEIDWPRPFTRVVLEPGATRNGHNRLLMTCSGQRVRIGRCLSDQERIELHGRIKDLLPPRWSASAVAAPHMPGEGLAKTR